ncbi:hypothetical protein K2X33_08485 [bacterium]|nr:hypothetical protein [bacterium]
MGGGSIQSVSLFSKRLVVILAVVGALLASEAQAGWRPSARALKWTCVAMLAGGIGYHFWPRAPEPMPMPELNISEEALEMDSYSTAPPAFSASALHGAFYLPPHSERTITFELFKGGWLEEQFGETVKGKIAEKLPEIAKAQDWSQPGMRIHVTIDHGRFQFEPDGRAKLRLTGPVFEIVSDQSMGLQEILSGDVLTYTFQQIIPSKQEEATEGQKPKVTEGAEVKIKAAFRFHPYSGELHILKAVGTFRIFAPIGTRETTFAVGPWVAFPGAAPAPAAQPPIHP